MSSRFLACAKVNLKLKANPATDLKTVVPRKEKLREKAFIPEDVHTILSATFATFSHLVIPEHAAARRWVPWLCAYTGARVNEITQLRGRTCARSRASHPCASPPRPGR